MANAQATIDVRLFANLAAHMPPDASHYSIAHGMTVAALLQRLKVPAAEAKLIFINGVKGHLHSRLQGGERVGIFPPVGGG
ncbi:MAG: MoaD/ThiS family protein [Desulfobacteraceae bacterium]|nr:MAG: MoaD/ThiS family protein [Desulfobacteraceae bacterium]